MFGLRKEFELLKKRLDELEEKENYQIKECIVRSSHSMAMTDILDRIIKHSKEGEPTYYLNNKLHASEMLIYINREEYAFSFYELHEYQSKEVSVDHLLLRDNIAYLTVTGSIDRHMDKTTKTFSFIVDYKRNKYILEQVTENKKTYNLDEVKIPSK